MANYRRNFVPGGSYFFTANLENRRTHLLTDHIDALRAAFCSTWSRHPFTIDAIVVLPDHLHAIWTLPTEDADFPLRWRLIKTAFSRSIQSYEAISPSRACKSERGIWQRRYWEHTLRDETDFASHCDYIHFNPVRHGYVAEPWEWPHSSFRRMVRLGIYPQQWLGPPSLDIRCGERDD